MIWPARGHRMISPQLLGFVVAMRDCLRLAPGALLWGGIPCCSYSDSITVLETWFWGFKNFGICPSSVRRYVWMSSSLHARYISILGDDRILVIYRELQSLICSISDTWAWLRPGVCSSWELHCGSVFAISSPSTHSGSPLLCSLAWYSKFEIQNSLVTPP